eukprot:EG_transcript_300
MFKLIFVWLALLIFPQFLHVAADSSSPSITLQGGGGSLPLPLLSNAFFSHRFVQPNVQQSFSVMSSTKGLCRMTMNYSDCDPGDNPLTMPPAVLDWVLVTAPLATKFYQRYPDLQMYPMVASMVAPIYNVPGASSVVLDLMTLSKIWTGRITTWDHPDIQATNPKFATWKVPANQSIRLIGRSGNTAATRSFQQVLAAMDPVFNTQTGNSGNGVWPGVQVRSLNGPQSVISAVVFTNYSLSYSAVGDALVNKVPMVKLNRSGFVVSASATSLQYALLELGLSFGNNGDDPAHLTGNIFGAVNPLAWPFASYAYLVVRTSTLRPGTTCDMVSAMVNFWVWFWNSDKVQTMASNLGFSIPPGAVRDYIVGQFQQNMQCGGNLVWQQAKVSQIPGYGPGSATPIFDKFTQAYSLVNGSVALNYTALATDQADPTPFLQAGGFVVTATPLPATANAVNLVLAGQVVTVVSQYTLTLDGLTLAKILNGDILTWQHPALLALNPLGVLDGSGKALNGSIALLQGPSFSAAALATLLQQFYPAYTGAAFLAAQKFNDPALLWSAVLATPASLSLLALVDNLPSELLLASIVSGGVAVAPTLANAQACAANATYDPSTKSVSVPVTNQSCYPLLLPLYVSMQRQCPPSATSAQTFAFLQWMFSGATLDAALAALNHVSFNALSAAVQAANGDALFQLSCAVRPVPTVPTNIVPLLLAIIIPIAVVVLVGCGLCGWWLWKITEYNRMMRKKFSNDNVAESCAEAIARFDLQAVAWLKEVKEPNKIQLAFLAIIGLLTEVKPYIPDQLLSQLTAKPASKEEDTEDEEGKSEAPTATPMAAQESFRQDPQGRGRPARGSIAGSPRSSRGLRSPMSVAGRPNRRFHMSIASSDGVRQVLAMKDWSRRRCTYMCVRFGSTSPVAEKRLPALVQAAGRIVDVAKAHGATIDCVGVDFVTLHWGVTAMSGALAARAVQAGLEMGTLRDALPEDQQAAFWLQMGIGKGLCDCGSVSSESGHRFFVVWGPEASLAMEVASANLPKRVLSSLLMSPAVYQEVQFSVQCMPRLWHGDALLWEPRALLKKKDDDEWMYELQQLEGSAGATLSHKTLLEAFLMAKDMSASAGDLAACIADMRAQFGAKMSPQDLASLDLLLASRTKPYDGGLP